MKNIDIFSLLKLNNPKIIDIRDSNTYKRGSIPNSINIPYLYLVTNPSNYLNKNDIYYLLCDSGSTSYRCCLELTEVGYNVINIDGGYNNYLKYNNR